MRLKEALQEMKNGKRAFTKKYGREFEVRVKRDLDSLDGGKLVLFGATSTGLQYEGDLTPEDGYLDYYVK